MERVSRIGMSYSSLRKLSGRFSQLGVKLDEPKIPQTHTVFLISENHPNFSEVMKIARDNELLILVEAKFSPEDYRQASHFTLFAMPKTYPSPSEGFEYRRITYDSSRACSVCGVGLRQIGPFRFERKIKLKERQIVGLHWIFDEIFVSLPLVSEVFARFGIETREVLNSNGKRTLPGVRQIVVPEIYVPIDGAELRTLKCSACSSEKYEPRRDIFFPRLEKITDAPIFKTMQYIGSGGEAFRQIIISKDVYDALIAAKAKSVIMDPIAV
jgi:hypothetical protein